MTTNDQVINRIKSAVKAGVKMKTIAECSDVTYYRLASVVNTDSYRQATTFKCDEIKRINTALDSIKDAI